MNQRQRMKLLLSNLLLLFLVGRLSLCISSETIVVSQTPDVSVLEGETVNINCCWTENIERRRVFWLKNQTFIKNDTNFTPEESMNKKANYCSTLIFPNITRKDSGRYICRVTVEIPFYREFDGNGTIITVAARENKNSNTDYHNSNDAPRPEVLIFVLRCLPIIALFSALFLIHCYVTKAQKNTSASPGSKSTPAHSRGGAQQENQQEDSD